MSQRDLNGKIRYILNGLADLREPMYLSPYAHDVLRLITGKKLYAAPPSTGKKG